MKGSNMNYLSIASIEYKAGHRRAQWNLPKRAGCSQAFSGHSACILNHSSIGNGYGFYWKNSQHQIKKSTACTGAIFYGIIGQHAVPLNCSL